MLEDNDYGRAVDWWGIGVVMYEMVSHIFDYIHGNIGEIDNLTFENNWSIYYYRCAVVYRFIIVTMTGFSY